MQKKRPSRKNMEENNKVTIIGKITEEFSFDYTLRGKNFYVSKVAVKRYSETMDMIPVIVSEDLLNSGKFLRKYVGKKAEMKGAFMSYNKSGSDGKTHLKLFLLVNEIHFVDGADKNEIFLRGNICKRPVYRITPKSETAITDLLIAVNRRSGGSDYIPCIAWYENAVSAGIMHTGDCVEIEGRIQSRLYFKNGGWREAYEISICKIERK